MLNIVTHETAAFKAIVWLRKYKTKSLWHNNYGTSSRLGNSNISFLYYA